MGERTPMRHIRPGKPVPSGTGQGRPLLLDVLTEDVERSPAAGGGKVAGGPEVALVGMGSEFGELLTQQAAGDALEAVDEGRERELGRVGHQQMDVIGLPVAFRQMSAAFVADDREDVCQTLQVGGLEDRSSVLRYKDQVRMQLEDASSSSS
jgi:hypothetical protein